MEGIIGKWLINASFVSAIVSLVFYGLAAREDDVKKIKWAHVFFTLKGLFLLMASIVLVKLIFDHQFQYYYVFNYTSLDLAPKYLWSAFYGGQEGSFMLWILFSWISGFMLIKWTRDPYRAPVMFFLVLTQVFLISMIVGWKWDGFNLGASPFRTIAEEMPDAPFIQANPDFVPADGSGLNDLLKSPWMMIHPPVLFIGFAMMTIPYCFAMAALWKRKYNEWVSPALPWTLGANLALLTAIFLGGYWAYITLSFGGYWAWDPVENASLVPWLIGTAGIHTMIIQRKSAVAQKSSLLFAILAYIAIVYETFLTRSGILADSSVHSFVDLGLYNQLLIFMLVVIIAGLGMFFYRYKELPSPDQEHGVLTREFMTVSGAMALFILGAVIILGTSSPIIGLLFNENPTPPEISFYNDWSMPIAIVMALMTVIGQMLFWQKHDSESLSTALIQPLMVTSFVTILAIMIYDVRNFYYMIYLFAGFFAITGNLWVLIRLAMKQPKLIGGTTTHVGFGLLLVGILFSSAYNSPLLDPRTADYNERVLAGEVTDEQGFRVSQTVEMLELKLNTPKILNGRYEVNYGGYSIDNQNRPGQQTYALSFKDLQTDRVFYMNPEVYPMLTTSTADNIQWSVDPDVRTGWLHDIYLYVAGSSYIEKVNNRNATNAVMQNVSDSADSLSQNTKSIEQIVSFRRGENKELGPYIFRFNDFIMVDSTDVPNERGVGVRAQIDFTHIPSNTQYSLEPLFAVYNEDGESYTASFPVNIEAYDLEVRFTKLDPENDSIELTIVGLPEGLEDEWILIVAEKKPLISVVWAGTFLLMIGFSISIFRHWGRERKLSV
jgi:cytochrome c-type biogenesis protein CcmF